MKKLLILIFLFSVNVFAQNKKNNFDKVIAEVRGDLNKDGLQDLVRVIQDTIADSFPYRLEVFFNQPSGNKKLIVSTDKLIREQYPNGKDGLRSEANLDTITIKNNVIAIRVQLTRGMFIHKFRYQKGIFELIGFTYMNADGLGNFSEEDFNLSTGVRYFKVEQNNSDVAGDKRKEIKRIRPLPKMQDFIPFEIEL